MEKNSLLDEILVQGPSAGSVALVLSKMKEDGRMGDVIRACAHFLSLYPDDVRLRTLLAESYEAMGFMGLAESEFVKAGRMIDERVSVYRSLAAIYEKQGRHAEAADMLRRYVAHYPEEPEALMSLNRLESKIASTKAVGASEAPAEDLVWDTEDEPEELVDFATPTIAELYFTQGRIDAAIQTYENVVARHPEDMESLTRLNALKEMLNPPAEPEAAPAPASRVKEERLIRILEGWLPKIRELRYA